jgi:hypothetical protein
MPSDEVDEERSRVACGVEIEVGETVGGIA